MIITTRTRRRNVNFINEFRLRWNSRGRLGEVAPREKRLKNKRGVRKGEQKEESLGITLF